MVSQPPSSAFLKHFDPAWLTARTGLQVGVVLHEKGPGGFRAWLPFAIAADMPSYRPPPVVWSWTGLYLGGHVGAGSGSSPFSDPAGPPIFGGTVRGSAALGGGQIGYNWQVPNTALVFGLEADADAISADGSGTCFASSGFFISANCRVHPDAGGSFAGRAGFATGPAGRTLLYVKGGVAWLDERIDITTNNRFSANVHRPRWGAMGLDGWRRIGTGADPGLVASVGIRLREVRRRRHGDVRKLFSGPSAVVLRLCSDRRRHDQCRPEPANHELGLNYKLGEDLHAQWQSSASDYHLRGTAAAPLVPDAENEIGGRV
jgi:opacity protein-like surface antigen